MAKFLECALSQVRNAIESMKFKDSDGGFFVGRIENDNDGLVARYLDLIFLDSMNKHLDKWIEHSGSITESIQKRLENITAGNDENFLRLKELFYVDGEIDKKKWDSFLSAVFPYVKKSD